MGKSEYDIFNQVLDEAKSALRVAMIGFDIPAHDYFTLTYVASGNGKGEIETVIYKTGGAGGTTVATLTLAYNSDDEIENITKA